MRKTGFFKNCEKCAKPTWCYQYNADKRRFCSTVCSNKTTNKQQSKTKRAKSFTRTSRSNTLYREWRYSCLVRDNYICQKCKKKLNKISAVVHHPKQWSDYPELRYTVSNGITLCRGCHNLVHILPNRKINHGF